MIMIKQAKYVKCVKSVESWFTENKIYEVFSGTKDGVTGLFIFDDDSETLKILMDKCCWALEEDANGLFVMTNEFVAVG